MSTAQNIRETDELTLGARIAQALSRSRSADPRTIAERVRKTLTISEVETLVNEALADRVRLYIAQSRVSSVRVTPSPPTPERAVHELPRKGGRIVWPSADELREVIGDGSYAKAAETLGVNAAVLRDYCKPRGILDDWARDEAESHRKRWQLLADITNEYSAKIRAEGIQIGLEQAKAERVYVAGQWMFLVDCTPEHLRSLADDYTKRAASNVGRGAYYLALAEQLEADGYADVRAMCEAN